MRQSQGSEAAGSAAFSVGQQRALGAEQAAVGRSPNLPSAYAGRQHDKVMDKMMEMEPVAGMSPYSRP